MSEEEKGSKPPNKTSCKKMGSLYLRRKTMGFVQEEKWRCFQILHASIELDQHPGRRWNSSFGIKNSSFALQ